MDAARGRRRWNYDVLLSFRGDDTCKNFAGHLFYALKEAGIRAFQDDNKFPDGDAAKLVQNSRFCVVIFSRNFAGSAWCLEQLVDIMGCKRTQQQQQQKVVPVFYDVDPSDVRKQTGFFSQAFAEYEEVFVSEKERVCRWRKALTRAADLSGWDLRNVADGHEAKFIREIVRQISRELNNAYLFVASSPVGLDTRLEVLDSLLEIGSDDVRMVGICGMGGIGKTTIAKAAYNKFFHCFEGQSFVADVRENSNLPNGLVRLQEKLLSDVLKAGKIKLNGVDMGIHYIKQKLSDRRVLLILDDVDRLDQLSVLAQRHWFGPGSRIIITTRDEDLLKQLQVGEIYRVEQLSRKESLELFSFHAFDKSYPPDDYVELSKSVVAYCEGLPLALIVLGSFLFKGSLIEWKSALEKLKRIPDGEVLKKLRISFDALSNHQEKDIFLDVACFFTNMDRDYVITILNGCGLSAEFAITVLTNRCLLTINEKNKLVMHDLLRDMGREIVREESLKEPGNRSRLWHYEDVHSVLQTHTGTEMVEGLALNSPTLRELQFRGEAFAGMKHLRFLKLNYALVTKGYGQISKELRWLCWHRFPLKSIPHDFDIENLIALDMRHSNLRQLWKDNKFLGKLRVLNLSHSPWLSRTPDFLSLPNLEKLILKGCRNLAELHWSIGCLQRLALVNVKDCESLKNLPRSIYRLKSLEVLNISGCLKVNELLDDIGEMASLRELLADGTMIAMVPDSIVKLKNLTTLSLCDCNATSSSSLSSLIRPWLTARRPERSKLLPTSLAGLISLTTLALKNCNLSSDAVPKDIGKLPSLKFLYLERNNFDVLPESISNLPKLEKLDVSYCTSLQSLPELPNSLTLLHANKCTSLERVSIASESFKDSANLILTNCKNLIEIQGFKNLSETGCWLELSGCNNLSANFRESILQGCSHIEFAVKAILPGNEIPSCFPYQCTGPSLTFQLSPTLNRQLLAFSIGVVYRFDDFTPITESPSVAIINLTKGLCLASKDTFIADTSSDHHEHICVYHLPLRSSKCTVDGGDWLQLMVHKGRGYSVKKCGLRLVFEEDGRRDSQTDSEGEEEINLASSSRKTNQGESQLQVDNNDGDVGPSNRWSNEEPPYKRMRSDPDLMEPR